MARKTKEKPKKKKEDKEEFIDVKRLISTGSTVFNLACSDNVNGGLQRGKMINLIGDSSSGKTIEAFSIATEVVHDKNCKDYRIIYDDVETALEINLSYLFGEELNKKVEAPTKDDDGEPKSSDTIQEFHNNILKAIENGKPFIYILDSFDALDEEGDIKKLDEQRKSIDKGTKSKGSYGMGKAKGASSILRSITSKLYETDSILIIISQTRDNVDPMSPQKKTRSGGRALKFYATHEIWLSMKKKIKSKDLIIGNNIVGKVSKNKITGKERNFEFPIYYDYGVDDIQSCINFLVELKYWKKSGKGKIIAEDFGIEGMMKKVIKEIEDNNLERKLKRLVGKVWKEREDSVKLSHRKRKY
ncbi:MAG: hypothetical protein GY870_15100 [archaeon]|nr:hypothetical protein [archaeon]